jgi:hypothetical protein
MKQLIVKINDTDVAQVRIDSVNELFIIEYCQPRQFTEDAWEGMSSHLERLITSLGDTCKSLDGGYE